MKNRKDGHCCWCGKYIPAGTGTLFHVGEEDEMLGLAPWGRTGWMVECIGKVSCSAEVARQRNIRAEKKEAKKQAEVARQKNIRAEKKEAKKQAEEEEKRLFPATQEYYVQGKNIILEGDRWEKEGKGQNIYGGGTWYVVDADTIHIWKVVNNGGDGDAWDENNVRTGGAGAMGWRYPATKERMDFLVVHAKNITEKEKKEAEIEKGRKEHIRMALLSMLTRTTWEQLEEAMRRGHKETFCPKELVKNGKETERFTIKTAKAFLQEVKINAAGGETGQHIGTGKK